MLGFFPTLNAFKEKLLGVIFSYLVLELVTAFMRNKVGPMHGMEGILVELKMVEDYQCVCCVPVSGFFSISAFPIFVGICCRSFIVLGCWVPLLKERRCYTGKREEKKGQRVHRKHKKGSERAQ